jgi:metal-responsive CopG/Arc/MetJ family transcriptional regulator
MKTIQMTIEAELLEQLDKTVGELGTSRSAFIRLAVQQALQEFQIQRLEEQHRAGYARQPVTADEFGGWEGEQAWGDE